MTEDPFSPNHCLTGEALLTMKVVDNNFFEMKKRFDVKYRT